MFELTNEQRVCFGLVPVEASWERLLLKPGRYDNFTTCAYVDGTTVRKCVRSGETVYEEWELCEALNEEKTHLLPKTARGKPVLLSSSTIYKRAGIGMRIWKELYTLAVVNDRTNQTYYSNTHEQLDVTDIESFRIWAERWCEETTPELLADVRAFAARERQHVRFREGDVFRFKLTRYLYGYGRILLDYDAMRKRKEPMWNVLMGKPLACSLYRIATLRDDLTVEELKDMPSLPSGNIMDNVLYYGEYEIIGNLPIREKEDYPILYGRSTNYRERTVHLQCGRLYRRLEESRELFSTMGDHAIGFRLHIPFTVIVECMMRESNMPYWNQDHFKVARDLRNPKNRKKLEQVCRQFGLRITDLV